MSHQLDAAFDPTFDAHRHQQHRRGLDSLRGEADRLRQTLEVRLLVLGNVVEQQAGSLELGGDSDGVRRHGTGGERAAGLVHDADHDERGVDSTPGRHGHNSDRLVQAACEPERQPCFGERIETALSERCPPMIWTPGHLPDPPTSIVQDSGTGQH